MYPAPCLGGLNGTAARNPPCDGMLCERSNHTQNVGAHLATIQPFQSLQVNEEENSTGQHKYHAERTMQTYLLQYWTVCKFLYLYINFNAYLIIKRKNR